MKLSRRFFQQKTLTVARELLGKILVRKIPSARTSAMSGSSRSSPLRGSVPNGSGQAAGVIRAIITETEAYCGSRDLASHASKGKTKRTEIMFGLPGHAYVYLIYGMYYCLNIVTEKENYPAAVLIRGIIINDENLNGPALTPERAEAFKKPCGEAATARLVSGPGKLCRFLKIDKTLNGEDTIKSRRLWIEDGKKLKPAQIGRAKRIGIDYAGPYKHKLWRFFIRSKS